MSVILNKSFPDGSVDKESTCNAGDIGDTGSIPGSGRSPGDGNGNSSILAWRIPWTGGYSPRGRKESDTTEHKHQESTLQCLYNF